MRLRGFRGHLDGVIGGALVGWVQVSGARDGVLVGLYAGGALLAQAPANVYRGDVHALDQDSGPGNGQGTAPGAGQRTGRNGFVLRLSPDLLAMIAANGGEAEVRVIGPHPHRLGRWRPDPATDRGAGSLPLPAPLPVPGGGILEKRLYADLQRLRIRLAMPPAPPRVPQPAPPMQARLFDTRDSLNGGTLPAPMFAYAEFLRLRDRLDGRFDPARDPDDIAPFLAHYLDDYGADRGGLRIPLSAPAIDWLNAPVTQAGLSRATRAFLAERPDLRAMLENGAPDGPLAVLYWWAAERVRALHCEDCLVPQACADRLAAVPAGHRTGPLPPETLSPETRQAETGRAETLWPETLWPVSEFMLRLRAATPALAGLRPETETGRRDLTCAVLVMALSRPDFLRYVPARARAQALAEADGDGDGDGDGETWLARFCATMGQPLPGLDRAAYAGALRQTGFDLDRLCFDSFTAEGHRAEFARHAPLPRAAAERRPDEAASQPCETARLPAPLPAPAPPVDIQVIGPFGKASGLGQATRLSATLLERAGHVVHRVDFSLDNPSPDDAARLAATDYRPARVNLLHLNAETVPLAAAYLPDVFSGAWNIAYPFWELDSPGACHFLGLDMVDEIWVSTGFGLTTFQPHTARPVINVGMSYETLPEIDREQARACLERAAGVPSGAFVFLVTFDSFSFMMRKNPLGVIAAFQRAFADTPGVRLVLKTQNRTRVADPAQAGLWQAVDRAVGHDSRIVLIDETLPYADLLRLKKGADAYLSLHRSEGWGFGLIEAMNLGVPVLATAYSGNMEFCTPDTCWLVDYRLIDVGPRDYIFVRPGQHWAEPDVADAARQMRALHDDPAERAARAAAARDLVRTRFSETAIAARYDKRMREILARLDTAAPPAAPMCG
jgi:glycosyltransferase involved in cell wall biosynthesis